MSKKKNKQNSAVSPPVSRQQIPSQQVKQSAGRPIQAEQPAKSKLPAGGIKPSIQAVMVLCIAAITWLFLKSCLDNQLTNWDDPGYIINNPLIKDISQEGLKNIFTKPIMGNYHPLTILSYALEYKYVRLQPFQYHLDSLLFHIIVTVLVYWFVNLLTRRPVAAAISALLFGLHPMHIESVAWLAGRKDVVYGMFYMAACIAYIYYIRAAGAKRWWLYAGVIFLFVCSLLAKPVAVVLPVTLLLVDYFEKRKLDYRLLLEKLPHFAIAIGFGIKSIKDQHTFGSLNTFSISYTFLERIALGGYALVTYLWKAVVPVGLCNFYPYPDKTGDMLAFQYYLYPLAVIAMLVLIGLFARKNKVIVFGSLFFLVNIVLLLQFIPVGGAILADRYTYIPYLGLFFMAGWLVSRYFEPGANKNIGYAAVGISLVYVLYLGYQSNERCKAWYDTTSLWRDEIEKEPVRAPNAYNNLGFNYFNKFNDAVNPAEKKLYYDSSFYLLKEAIHLQASFANPYISLGELERSVNNFPEAKRYYYKALSLKSTDEDANAYLGLGIIYAISHNFDSAGYCFRMAITMKPYFPEAHSNYGNYYDMMNNVDSSLPQYAIALQQNPDMFAPHLNRGRELQRLHRCDEAMKDFEAAMALNPDDGEIYYARSYCYAQKGNKALALKDIEKAISLGFTQVDKSFYEAMKK